MASIGRGTAKRAEERRNELRRRVWDEVIRIAPVTWSPAHVVLAQCCESCGASLEDLGYDQAELDNVKSAISRMRFADGNAPNANERDVYCANSGGLDYRHYFGGIYFSKRNPRPSNFWEGVRQREWGTGKFPFAPSAPLSRIGRPRSP